MFRIDLTSLEPGLHHFTREVEADALKDSAGESSAEEAYEEVAFGDVQVEAVLDYQPDRALVTFQARTTATLTCDRTLQRFEQPLEGGYAVLFAEPGRSVPDEGEEHDEVRELPPGARYLDLTDAVRDTLLLAVPQRKVAPGAEEEEIETVFGAPTRSEGDPVDPRWEKLRELRTNQNSS